MAGGGDQISAVGAFACHAMVNRLKDAINADRTKEIVTGTKLIQLMGEVIPTAD